MAAFVQSATADTSTGSVTSKAVAAINLTTGNNVIVGVRWENNDTTVSISDTAGNTYEQAGTNQQMQTTGAFVALFYCSNATGNASNVITATWGAARTYTRVYAIEWSSTYTAAYVSSSQATGTGTALSSTGLSASGDGALFAVGGSFSNRTFTTGGDIANIRETSNFAGLGDLYFTGTGTKTPGMTISSANSNAIIGALFSDISAGGGGAFFPPGLMQRNQFKHLLIR